MPGVTPSWPSWTSISAITRPLADIERARLREAGVGNLHFAWALARSIPVSRTITAFTVKLAAGIR